MDDEENEHYRFKVLFIGESGIGTKTCLINRIVNGNFNQNLGPTTSI